MGNQFSIFKRDDLDECRIFIDGAARGNPGLAGAGIQIVSSKEEVREAFFLGEKTNNQAEYLSLLLALFIFKQKFDFKDVYLIICSDSELLVRQLCGFYKVKNPILIRLKDIVERILKGIPHKIVHITREKNKVADKLANVGIDKEKKIPTNFFRFLSDFGNVDELIKFLKK